MSPAPTARARYAMGVFTALVCLAPLTAYLWPFGFSAFTPIAAIVLIPVFRAGRTNEVVIALVALLALALLSVLWSPVFDAHGPIDGYADAETQTWAKLMMQLGLYALLTVTAARMPQAGQVRLAGLFAVGATALAAVLLIEGATGAAIYRSLTEAIGDPVRPDLARRNVAQGTYALALMYWPALAVLLHEDRRRMALLLTAGAVAAPFLLSAMAPLAALIVGGAVYGAARRFGPGTWRWIGGGFAAATMLTPWLVLAARPVFPAISEAVGASWAARLEIWLFSAQRAAEKLWLGWGLDGSRAFQPFMLHPHNASIQLWLELGILGAVLASVVWWLLARRAAGIGAHALAAAASYFVIGALSFGVWQEWWLGLGAMTVIWCLVARAAIDRPYETVIEA